MRKFYGFNGICMLLLSECNTPGQVIWQGASTCVVLHPDRTDC